MIANQQLLHYAIGILSGAVNYAPARPVWKSPPVHASKHRKARAQRFAAKGAKR